MNRVFFLDSGPLGLLTHPQRTAEVLATSEWLSRCLLAGVSIMVPAIVYYETRRELLRANKTLGIGRLDAFVNADARRYLPLTDRALRLAAELWARSRQRGRPTAEPGALDIDVLIAAQAMSFDTVDSEIVVITANPKHLRQLVAASHWNEITP